MNLSTLARASSLSTAFTSRTLHRSITHRPISCSSLSYKPLISTTPKTPLFLRPPIFSATLTDLQKFQNWAKTLASSVGSSFMESDNGPDSEILHRELNWLIQDAVETPSLLSNQTEGEFDSVVRLRADLGDLYMLWKQRIEKRRPFQYVVGCEHWRDLVLSVEEGVLIPRPETELIVDLVEDVVKESDELKGGLWVDLGTGSGALAIGIGRVLGDHGRVIATDVSPVAVQVALYNVKRGVHCPVWPVLIDILGRTGIYGFSKKLKAHLLLGIVPFDVWKFSKMDKVSVKQGSWFDPVRGFEGQVAGLVSNPPYIPSGQIKGLQAEVGKHEPLLALDGGEDGISDLLHLCNGAAFMLKPGGFFAFETNGEDQCRFLVDHMESIHNGNFYDLKIVPDFAGIQRIVTGIRS